MRARPAKFLFINRSKQFLHAVSTTSIKHGLARACSVRVLHAMNQYRLPALSASANKNSTLYDILRQRKISSNHNNSHIITKNAILLSLADANRRATSTRSRASVSSLCVCNSMMLFSHSSDIVDLR